ncbi:alpha/beta hydrolase [Balneolales bacterium ANBcel1]|nr:alpha/beta hydrolase [Balneolales bacterium ANBcel1]
MRNKYICGGVIILLTFLVNTQAPAQKYSKSWTDINYAGSSESWHNLDIYLPAIEKEAYPVVIYIYGSAWYANNAKGADMETIGKALLDAGFAVVTPNHRASTDATFPAQVHDIKAVIRYVRANADKHRLDTAFVGISGSSSGGHLAAMAGTTRFTEQFTVGNETVDIEGSLGDFTHASSSVDAVVNWFGPVHFPVTNTCGSEIDRDAANSPESTLIGESILDNEDLGALISPITYIDAGDPPFLNIHGDEDRIVPLCQSELLHEALVESGVSSRLVIAEGGGHGPGVHVDEYLEMMVDFFLKQATKQGGSK